jgi:hypothetical protein
MLPDTGIDDVKKQRNAEYAKHINDPVLSSLNMEGTFTFIVDGSTATCFGSMPTLRIHFSHADHHNQACHNTNSAATVATRRKVLHVEWKNKKARIKFNIQAQRTPTKVFSTNHVSTQRETGCNKLALRFPI